MKTEETALDPLFNPGGLSDLGRQLDARGLRGQLAFDVVAEDIERSREQDEISSIAIRRNVGMDVAGTAAVLQLDLVQCGVFTTLRRSRAVAQSIWNSFHTPVV